MNVFRFDAWTLKLLDMNGAAQAPTGRLVGDGLWGLEGYGTMVDHGRSMVNHGRSMVNLWLTMVNNG